MRAILGRRERAVTLRKVIVGLGNPGPEYARHRHNVGFRLVDRLAERHRFARWWSSHRALITEGEIAGEPVALVKPLTFMNLSGQAVKPILKRYAARLEDLLVVYDDLDLDVGTLRLRAQGSSGGHKGVQSLVDVLGTREFPRLRVGIGRPPHGDAVDYVLHDFSLDEGIEIERAMDRAEEAVVCWLTRGMREAMDRFNAVLPRPASGP